MTLEKGSSAKRARMAEPDQAPHVLYYASSVSFRKLVFPHETWVKKLEKDFVKMRKIVKRSQQKLELWRQAAARGDEEMPEMDEKQVEEMEEAEGVIDEAVNDWLDRAKEVAEEAGIKAEEAGVILDEEAHGRPPIILYS